MKNSITFRALALALSLTLISGNMAFASQKTETDVHEVRTNNSYSVRQDGIIPGAHWDKDPAGWRYLDADGTPLVGYFYDSTGDMYYSGPTGFIIKNSKDPWGQDYNNQGELINSGYRYDASRFRELSTKLESGSNVYFDTLDELHDFIEYYGKVYNYGRQNLTFKTFKKRKLNSKGDTVKEEFFVNNSLNMIYDRDDILHDLEGLFPEHLVGATLEEKVRDAAQKVDKVFNLDESDLNRTMKEAIQLRSGCCWHIVRATQFLFDRDNIPYEIVTGKSYGVSHIWFRFTDEAGNRIYSDPTLAASGLNGYDIIDYRVYKDNYKNYKFFG